MSELKATMGPFVAKRSDNEEVEFWTIEQAHEMGEDVAYMTLKPESGTLEGNANLFSASHDLYEALADLVDAYEGEPGFGPARKALAKARGES